MGRKRSKGRLPVRRGGPGVPTCRVPSPNGFGSCGLVKYHGGNWHRGVVNGRLQEWRNTDPWPPDAA
jgi:hypothetical protein